MHADVDTPLRHSSLRHLVQIAFAPRTRNKTCASAHESSEETLALSSISRFWFSWLSVLNGPLLDLLNVAAGPQDIVTATVDGQSEVLERVGDSKRITGVANRVVVCSGCVRGSLSNHQPRRPNLTSMSRDAPPDSESLRRTRTRVAYPFIAQSRPGQNHRGVPPFGLAICCQTPLVLRRVLFQNPFRGGPHRARTHSRI